MNSGRPRSFFLSSLPFFILAHATHHLLTALPQPMQPFIQDEFGLSKAQLGGVTAAFSLSSGAAQLPAGWLADRIGPTWLITIGVLGVGIGAINNFFKSREARSLQVQIATFQNKQAIMNNLITEAMQYSQRNPSIDPILESIGAKPAKAAPAAATKPLGK